MLLEHFNQSIVSFRAHSEHLCTIGEKACLDRWQNLSGQAQQLYIWLYHRKPRLFRRDQINYVQENKFTINQENRSIESLRQFGFLLDCTFLLSSETYLQQCNRVQIDKLCKVLNQKANGNKVDCINRIQNLDFPRPIPMFQLVHKALFEQIVASYTLSHHGTLQPLLLAEIDTIPIQYHPYTLTKQVSIHATRTEYRSYKDWKQGNAEQIPLCYPLSPIHFRFSGLRFWILHLLNNVPKTMTGEYIASLQKTLPYAHQYRLDIQLRLARSLLSMSRGKEGLDVLKMAFYQTDSLLDRIRLRQTGNHLARRLKKSFPPLKPIQSPFMRTLHWKTKKRGSRQTFNGETVELAVLQHIETTGRSGFRTENAPWNALLTLLMLDILFLPVEDQFPSPILTAPLDFNTRQFYQRRKEPIEERFGELTQYSTREIIYHQVSKLAHPIEQYRIRGLNWSQYTLESLLTFADNVPTSVLDCILRHKLLFPTDAHRGLPDLCITAGDVVTVDKTFPSKLPAHFFFLEVKSEQDTVSPYQKHWFHVLQSAECTVEVWNIQS